METVSFRQLPLIVRVAVGIALYGAWTSLEGLVIDRYGLWHYMPYYRVGDPCVWDLAVALLIVFALWRLTRQRATPPPAAAEETEVRATLRRLKNDPELPL
jgi:hypothetical protein